MDKIDEKNGKEDYLELHNKAKSEIEDCITELKNLRHNLNYAFPHIGDDLKYIILKLTSSRDNYSSAMKANISSQLESHKSFIGEALTGMLNKGQE